MTRSRGLPPDTHVRIAIASSGLGHVARGIEAWAADTAVALARRGVDVTLFAGETLQGGRATGLQGGGTPDHGPRAADHRQGTIDRGPEIGACQMGPSTHSAPTSVLPCWKRGGRTARLAARVMPAFAWRWGLKSAYGWEQVTFWLRLAPMLKAGRYDILHVQDPMIAFWCRLWRKRGWLKTKEILAHGTEEPLEFLSRFQYVQELAPYYLDRDEESFGGRGSEVRSQKTETSEQSAEARTPLRVLRTTDARSGMAREWFSIPNFVDTQRFSPSVPPTPRSEFAISEDAFIILCVSAIKRTHKRVDVVIDAVAQLIADTGGIPSLQSSVFNLQSSPQPSIHLIVAGAREQETEEIIAYGGDRLGDHLTILANFPRERMPGLYRMADILVHGSLVEMMPIALIEAMASSLPIVAHKWPVIEWTVGPGGTCVDATRASNLADAAVPYLAPLTRRAAGLKARQHAVGMFSEVVVVEQMLNVYKHILSA